MTGILLDTVKYVSLAVYYLLVIIEEMSTFLSILLNKKRKKKIGHFMMEKL